MGACFIVALAVILFVIATKITQMRKLLYKMARYIGLADNYQVYSICDDKLRNDFIFDDGTESTTEDFQYISTQS